MANLPAVNGSQTIRTLRKFGFRLDRIEGSHHMMVKDGHPRTVPVPVHGSKPLPKGTLASNSYGWDDEGAVLQAPLVSIRQKKSWVVSGSGSSPSE